MKKKNSDSLYDKGLIGGISGIAAGTVFIINILLKFVMRRFSAAEKHETQTKMNVSVAFKLTIARFINSSLVLVIVNSESRSWYKGGDLVYDATLLICILVFQGPILELLYIPGIVKLIKKRVEQANGDDCTLTQREANLLCEGHTLDVANNISNFMNMIMTCCFYCPLIPQAIPLAMISTIICYWTTKYSMLMSYKMPVMFSYLMATFFSNLMPWLVLACTLSAVFF